MVSTVRAAYSVTAPDRDPAWLERVSERRGLLETGPRLYATSGFGQSAVEAASQTRHAELGRIKRVMIRASDLARSAAGVAEPDNADEAWWSIPFAVAVTLVTGRPIGETSEPMRQSEAVRRILGLTDLLSGPDGPGAEIEIVSEDGRHASARIAAPIGHPTRPATTTQVVEKWDREPFDPKLILSSLDRVLLQPWPVTVGEALGAGFVGTSTEDGSRLR